MHVVRDLHCRQYRVVKDVTVSWLRGLEAEEELGNSGRVERLAIRVSDQKPKLLLAFLTHRKTHLARHQAEGPRHKIIQGEFYPPV